MPSGGGARPAGPSSTSEIAEGSLYVGSPETVARKIAATVRALGASRFDLKYSAGTLGHELMLRSIELYGREVIPRVRELVSEVTSYEARQGKVCGVSRRKADRTLTSSFTIRSPTK